MTKKTEQGKASGWMHRISNFVRVYWREIVISG